MNKILEEKVAKAMYDCSPASDAPTWEEAEDSTRQWLLDRAGAALEAVHADLEMFVSRNLTGEALTIGKILIQRVKS